MTIYLATDHAGFTVKERVKKFLIEKCYDVIDCGAESFNADDDYPDYIAKAAELTARKPESRGVVFGGSGQGEAMVANRVKGVRCAVFYGASVAKQAIDIKGESSSDPFVMVRLEREHNNANMLSLGVRFLTEEESMKAIAIFLETPFAGAERHVRRLKKFN